MTGLFRKGAALSADSRGHASAPIAGRRKRKARRRQSGCGQAKAGNGADCIVPCFIIRTCGPRKRRIVLCSLCKSANSAFSACGGRSGPMHGFESQFTVLSFSASTRLRKSVKSVSTSDSFITERKNISVSAEKPYFPLSRSNSARGEICSSSAMRSCEYSWSARKLSNLFLSSC